MKYRVGVSGQLTVEAADPFEAVQIAMAETVAGIGGDDSNALHLSVSKARFRPNTDEDTDRDDLDELLT